MDTLDRERALDGYCVELSTGETLHVWHLGGDATLVVAEGAGGQAVSASTSEVARIPLTDENATLLGDLWAAMLTNWRRARRRA